MQSRRSIRKFALHERRNFGKIDKHVIGFFLVVAGIDETAAEMVPAADLTDSGVVCRRLGRRRICDKTAEGLFGLFGRRAGRCLLRRRSRVLFARVDGGRL